MSCQKKKGQTSGEDRALVVEEPTIVESSTMEEGCKAYKTIKYPENDTLYESKKVLRDTMAELYISPV